MDSVASILQNEDLLSFIKEYLETRKLLKGDFQKSDGQRELIYQNEEQFWKDVIDGTEIYETRRVTLKDFLILEWTPLAPGQYHTHEGSRARREAEDFIRYSEPQGRTVFDPYGKARMVQGGYGCLRLTSKTINNEALRFLCATSSGVVHRSVLIGVPYHEYEKIAYDIERGGGLIANLIGQLRYWPPDNSLPFLASTDLPRVYIHVQAINPIQKFTRKDEISVSGAITFEIAQPDPDHYVHPGVYFAFASFNPFRENELDSTVKWLEDYTKRDYKGTILTDFDEIHPHFSDVFFPVDQLMSETLETNSIRKTIERFTAPRNYRGARRDIKRFAIFIQNLIVEGNMTNITIHGDGNVVGDNNRVVTRINKGLLSNDFQNIAQALAQFKADIVQNDKLPDKTRNQATRALEDVEDEVVDENPDPKAIEDGLERTKSILEKAGQVFDKIVGWGPRLILLYEAIKHHIPGNWTAGFLQ